MAIDLERIEEIENEENLQSFNRIDGKKDNRGKPLSDKSLRTVALKIMLTKEESERLFNYANEKHTSKSTILQQYIRRLPLSGESK